VHTDTDDAHPKSDAAPDALQTAFVLAALPPLRATCGSYLCSPQ